MAKTTHYNTTDTVGYANRAGVCLIFLAPIAGSGDMLVVGGLRHSMRDPAAFKGPSHRPDFGRTYKGEPR